MIQIEILALSKCGFNQWLWRRQPCRFGDMIIPESGI